MYELANLNKVKYTIVWSQNPYKSFECNQKSQLSPKNINN